eukprot:5887035-Pleurochrysis_carterae.AAC.3
MQGCRQGEEREKLVVQSSAGMAENRWAGLLRCGAEGVGVVHEAKVSKWRVSRVVASLRLRA